MLLSHAISVALAIVAMFMVTRIFVNRPRRGREVTSADLMEAAYRRRRRWRWPK